MVKITISQQSKGISSCLYCAKQAKHDNYIGKEKAVKIGASTVTIYYDYYDGAKMLGIFPEIQNKAERKAKIKDLKKQ